MRRPIVIPLMSITVLESAGTIRAVKSVPRRNPHRSVLLAVNPAAGPPFSPVDESPHRRARKQPRPCCDYS